MKFLIRFFRADRRPLSHIEIFLRRDTGNDFFAALRRVVDFFLTGFLERFVVAMVGKTPLKMYRAYYADEQFGLQPVGAY